MTYYFDRDGVAQLLDDLHKKWENTMDTDNKEHIKISIDDRLICIPKCANTTGSIDFLLKELLVCALTGNTTLGNTQECVEEMQELFNSHYEHDDEDFYDYEEIAPTSACPNYGDSCYFIDPCDCGLYGEFICPVEFP